VAGVRWLVVGCALTFPLIASRNSRSELPKVENGPSTEPIDATSFVEEHGNKTRLGAEEQM
jgi:hypothetical protein